MWTFWKALLVVFLGNLSALGSFMLILYYGAIIEEKLYDRKGKTEDKK